MKKILSVLLIICLLFCSCGSDMQGQATLSDQHNELSEEEIKKAMKNADNDITDRPDYNVCYVSIVCNTALDSGKLSEDMLSILPSDGAILSEYEVLYDDNATVFDVLLSAIKDNKIHFEYTGTKTVPYIEGINNLYEFDCGSLSGWMYRVNGWFPTFGIGQYRTERGDRIEIIYTCDLGKDVGENYKMEQ